MNTISKVHARQILDSRGNPTLEAEIVTTSGKIGRAAVPSGASTGLHEAVELRDGDKRYYLGKSVTKAVENVNVLLKEALINCSVFEQSLIDERMIALDGTSNKSRLGANAILAVSIAVAKAAAQEAGLPLYRYLGGNEACMLPMPMLNIINGGMHADNAIDLQEYMIVPMGATTFSEALHMGVCIFHHLRMLLRSKGLSTNVGDEGGFAPNLSSNEAALALILEAIERAGYEPGKEVGIALDAASSSFYEADEQLYHLRSSGEKLNAEEMVSFWEHWVNKYPIVSIEDGMAENDWAGWQHLTHRLGDKVQLVGDDLFVTNVSRIMQGAQLRAANAVLIKMNQIGTLTETIQSTRTALSNHYAAIISHRSGETEDTTIADLAVALQTGQIKAGAPSRSDRVAKYNQLLRIEEELGSAAQLGTLPQLKPGMICKDA